MKFYYMLLPIFFVLCFDKQKVISNRNDTFSYDLLALDSLPCNYIDLSKAKLKSTKNMFFNRRHSVKLREFELDKELNLLFFKYDFISSEKLTNIRDEIGIYGNKFKIDSLFYGVDYYNKPYIFSSIVNISKFKLGNRCYVAFFIQDISNPVAFPNSLILLFDITDINRIIYIRVGFQASEDMKCFNDFNKDGILDFAKWTRGYEFEEYLYRYELSNKYNFTIQKDDYVYIFEQKDGYYIDRHKSRWAYGYIR